MTIPGDTPHNGDSILVEKGMAFTKIGPAAGNSQRLAREYLDSLQVEMRVIDARQASPAAHFFGHDFAAPLFVTALSALDRVRPNGMEEMAKGAHAFGTMMWVGIGTNDELERVVGTGVKTVKIVKPYADNDVVFKKIEHANACGAVAVGMDVSYGFGMKNGYSPAPMAPKSSSELEQFIAASTLPFIVKGVLSRRDADKAMRAGAAGIAVSHQGGTVLDFAVPPVRILPEIAEAARRRIPVFVDCCMQSGMDAFKAMALGADGVGVGQAVLSGLAAAGADGVTRVLSEMTKALRRIMSLTGTASVRDMDGSLIWPSR